MTKNFEVAYVTKQGETVSNYYRTYENAIEVFECLCENDGIKEIIDYIYIRYYNSKTETEMTIQCFEKGRDFCEKS